MLSNDRCCTVFNREALVWLERSGSGAFGIFYRHRLFPCDHLADLVLDAHIVPLQINDETASTNINPSFEPLVFGSTSLELDVYDYTYKYQPLDIPPGMDQNEASHMNDRNPWFLPLRSHPRSSSEQE